VKNKQRKLYVVRVRGVREPYSPGNPYTWDGREPEDWTKDGVTYEFYHILEDLDDKGYPTVADVLESVDFHSGVRLTSVEVLTPEECDHGFIRGIQRAK
jgi:hypothetical protein